MTKKNKLLDIIWFVVMSIAILGIILECWYLIRVNCVYKLDYKDNIEMTSMKYVPIRPSTWTEEEYIEILEELVGYNNYNLSKYDFDIRQSADCNLITKNIRIDYNLSFENFVFSFTHELIHLKYFTGNERFVNYNTWLILYECDNFYLNNVAKCYADLDFKGNISYDYSCAGYIEDYLKGI